MLIPNVRTRYSALNAENCEKLGPTVRYCDIFLYLCEKLNLNQTNDKL